MTTELDSISEETSVPKPKVEEKSEDTERSEIKSEMPVKKDPSPPKITNPEGDKEENPKRSQVNKKVSAMSKNTKEKQKDRRLSKPSTTIPQGSLSKMMTHQIWRKTLLKAQVKALCIRPAI